MIKSDERESEYFENLIIDATIVWAIWSGLNAKSRWFYQTVDDFKLFVRGFFRELYPIRGHQQKNNFLLKIINVVIDRETMCSSILKARLLLLAPRKRWAKREKCPNLYSNGSFWMPTSKHKNRHTQKEKPNERERCSEKKKLEKDWKTKNPQFTWSTWMGF